MKKIVLLISFIFLFQSINVYGAEKITIIYDANDGSGRTKVVELDKGDEYRLLGSDAFDNLNDDSNDPMDDKVILGWMKNPDDSRYTYATYAILKNNPNSSSQYNMWESLNSQTEITLYAMWDKREDISNLLAAHALSGEGATLDDDGNDLILEKKDFIYTFTFQENLNQQILQLSYYKLPKYFTNVLPFYVKEELKDPSAFKIRVSDGSNTYQYFGEYYIVDDILYVDIIDRGDQASQTLYAASNLRVTFMYGMTWVQKEVNNRNIYSATITFNWSNHKDPVEVYQQGRIISKYLDVDTNEELLVEKTDTGVVGSTFNIDSPSIDGYELIKVPQELEFEEEDQTIEYLYKKSVDKKPILTELINKTKSELTNPNTNTSNVIIVIILIIIANVVSLCIIKRRNAL